MMDLDLVDTLFARPYKPGIPLLTRSEIQSRYLTRYYMLISAPGDKPITLFPVAERVKREPRREFWEINFDLARRQINLESREDKALETLKERHRYYGAGPLLLTGEIGIIVRSIDKLERIRFMTENKLEDKQDPLEDAWVDLFAYSILGYLLVRGGLS